MLQESTLEDKKFEINESLFAKLSLEEGQEPEGDEGEIQRISELCSRREKSCATQRGRNTGGSGLLKETLMFTQFLKNSLSNTIRVKRENQQKEN